MCHLLATALLSSWPRPRCIQFAIVKTVGRGSGCSECGAQTQVKRRIEGRSASDVVIIFGGAALLPSGCSE